MGVKIDGIEYSSKEIEGTDLEAVKKFCQKNKVKAAYIVYVDKDDSIQSSGIYFRNKERDILDKYVNKRFGNE